jgi:serine/threonine protein kinase
MHKPPARNVHQLPTACSATKPASALQQPLPQQTKHLQRQQQLQLHSIIAHLTLLHRFLQTLLSVPNITHMWSAYASQDKFHILMEYCSGGNLLERLKSAAAPMPEQQLAAQVRHGMV